MNENPKQATITKSTLEITDEIIGTRTRIRALVLDNWNAQVLVNW